MTKLTSDAKMEFIRQYVLARASVIETNDVYNGKYWVEEARLAWNMMYCIQVGAG